MAIAQESSSKTFDFHEERHNLRALNAQIIGIMFIVAGVFFVGVGTMSSTDGWLILVMPPLFLAAGGIVSLLLKDRNSTRAGLALTGTLVISIAFQQIFVDYQTNIHYLLILAVIIGVIFLKIEHIMFLPIMAVVVLLGTDMIVHQSLQLTMDTFYISILAFFAAGIGYAVLDHAQGLIEWALDSQNKNFVRAESFYSQGEQLRKATYELERAKEQVEEISGAKSMFLSNMSHELRTPLNMVIGYTSSILEMPQMYDNQEIPEIFRKDIQLIKSSGEYLLTLINDILDLSKIESGKFEINPVAFEIAPVLEGVMATALGLVKEKPIQIKPDYDPDLPLIWGDPMRVRQIMLNLMSNAIKYTVSGAVTLSVKKRDGELYIAIIDTGVGIPQETIATIFDRFEQVQNNSNIQGTGLGLDISQRLAHMHDSEINIESTVGVGSTFSFTLPFATAEQTAEFKGTDTIHELSGIKRFDTVEPEKEPEASWKTKRTVLIAEDDSVTRDLLKRTFEANNYVVFDVQDGDDVYDTASALLPQLVILDIVLPNRDGWDILDDLKSDEDTDNIPVIVLSAYIDQNDARLEKADHYITKPINMHSILKHADNLIKNNELVPQEI